MKNTTAATMNRKRKLDDEQHSFSSLTKEILFKVFDKCYTLNDVIQLGYACPSLITHVEFYIKQLKNVNIKHSYTDFINLFKGLKTPLDFNNIQCLKIYDAKIENIDDLLALRNIKKLELLNLCTDKEESRILLYNLKERALIFKCEDLCISTSQSNSSKTYLQIICKEFFLNLKVLRLPVYYFYELNNMNLTSCHFKYSSFDIVFERCIKQLEKLKKCFLKAPFIETFDLGIFNSFKDNGEVLSTTDFFLTTRFLRLSFYSRVSLNANHLCRIAKNILHLSTDTITEISFLFYESSFYNFQYVYDLLSVVKELFGLFANLKYCAVEHIVSHKYSCVHFVESDRCEIEIISAEDPPVVTLNGKKRSFTRLKSAMSNNFFHI